MGKKGGHRETPKKGGSKTSTFTSISAASGQGKLENVGAMGHVAGAWNGEKSPGFSLKKIPEERKEIGAERGFGREGKSKLFKPNLKQWPKEKRERKRKTCAGRKILATKGIFPRHKTAYV